MSSQGFVAALHAHPLLTERSFTALMQLSSWDPEEAWDRLLLRCEGEGYLASGQQEYLHSITRILEEQMISVYWKEGSLFSRIAPAPMVLYCKGEMSLLDMPILSVIGTRTITSYGKQVVERLIPPLIHRGWSTMSGCARGVDALVHRITMVSGGFTIGVLGTGIDRCYPREHVGLQEEIVRLGGLLISELPLGTGPRAWHFPKRNRIIAALGKALLVVEASSRSGTLHTVACAGEVGTPVFAVPGSIFSPMSSGVNELFAYAEPRVYPLLRPQDLDYLFSNHDENT